MNSTYPRYGITPPFKYKSSDIKNTILSYRYHQTRTNEKQEAVRAAFGAAAGTLVPLLFFAKKQHSNILNIKYGIKEIAGVATGSIVGGVLGGRIDNNKHDQIQKVKEGVFQLSNAVIPPAIVLGINKISKNSKSLNNIPAKIASTIAGLGAGMILSAKISNKICDPKDLEPDRKLTIKDSIANVDDALGVLAMSNFPALHKLFVLYNA